MQKLAVSGTDVLQEGHVTKITMNSNQVKADDIEFDEYRRILEKSKSNIATIIIAMSNVGMAIKASKR